MKTTAIITAAGSGVRWDNYLGTVKQLAPIVGFEGTEPLIIRTIRMLKDLGINDIYVLTHEPKIISAVQGVCQVIPPTRYQYLSDTILSSKGYWSEKTIILLGDVYFSHECLKSMIYSQRNLCFWGVERGSLICKQKLKRAEIYGLTFDYSVSKIVEANLILNSILSSMRDKGFLPLRVMRLGWRIFLLILRQNYSPKPPRVLHKMGVRRNFIWRVYKLFFGVKPRHAWLYGKLWGLYMTIYRINPFSGKKFTWPEKNRDGFSQVEDITQDIDNIQDYQNLIKKIYTYEVEG